MSENNEVTEQPRFCLMCEGILKDYEPSICWNCQLVMETGEPNDDNE